MTPHRHEHHERRERDHHMAPRSPSEEEEEKSLPGQSVRLVSQDRFSSSATIKQPSKEGGAAL